MNSYSKKVAAAMCKSYIKEAYELRQKKKLTKEELKTLRRFRELAHLVKVTGV